MTFVGERTDVLREPLGPLVGRLFALVAIGVAGVLLLALPHRWTEDDLPTRHDVLGGAFLLMSTAVPPLARRLLRGGATLTITADGFAFTSGLGDATVRWAACGPIAVGHGRSSGPYTRGPKVVSFFAAVTREPTQRWRLRRRSGGTRWELARLPSTYGMSAEHLAALLNAHHAAVPETETAPPETVLGLVARSRRRTGLALAACVVVSVAGVVVVAAVPHHAAEPRACAPSLAAARDADMVVVQALGGAGPDADAAARLMADAETLGAEESAASASLASTLDALDTDVRQLSADEARGDLDASESEVETFVAAQKSLADSC